MLRTLTTAVLALAASCAAHAELELGAPAPDFTTEASLGGQPFTFALKDALAKGPVVMYFYPAAFTPGCTVEAHQFAEASDDFAALGATLIGMSTDDIDTLNRFSVEACRNKFAVAADPDRAITQAYDATLAMKPSLADRTTYLIAPDGTIAYVYSGMKPDPHISNTLEALRAWRAAHPVASGQP